MHSYLIISDANTALDSVVQKILVKQKAKLLEFPVQKIEDARKLNAFTKLTLSEKTAILIKDFQNATEEAVNSLLKNLEEPQDNLIYILHAKSENALLSTIISRCQLIYAKRGESGHKSFDAEKFLTMDVLGKTNFIKSLKDRPEALEFSRQIVNNVKLELKKMDKKNYEDVYNLAKASIHLTKSLEKNANVNLAYLRFIAEISN